MKLHDRSLHDDDFRGRVGQRTLQGNLRLEPHAKRDRDQLSGTEAVGLSDGGRVNKRVARLGKNLGMAAVAAIHSAAQRGGAGSWTIGQRQLAQLQARCAQSRLAGRVAGSAGLILDESGLGNRNAGREQNRNRNQTWCAARAETNGEMTLQPPQTLILFDLRERCACQ